LRAFRGIKSIKKKTFKKLTKIEKKKIDLKKFLGQWISADENDEILTRLLKRKSYYRTP